MDHLDASAFHAAHLAAPDLPPDRLRLAIDAYLADAGITLRQIRSAAALSPAEADAAFQPATWRSTDDRPQDVLRPRPR